MKKIKNDKIDIPILLFRIISLIIIVVSLYLILNWYFENEKTGMILENISSSVISTNSDSQYDNYMESDNNSLLNYKIDFDNLLSQNSNTVAWLKVNNTEINYPVVKYSNNSFYLNHSFDNSYNSAGWTFADCKNTFDNTDKNIIIYGHNRRDGSMFASLKNVLKSDWYSNSDNYIINLTTPNGNIGYKVFSVYSIKAETYYCNTNFPDDNEYNNFLSTIQNRSIYNFNEDLHSTNSILTLSTCANDNTYRVVLHAKKI